MNECDSDSKEEQKRPYNISVLECAGPFLEFNKCPEKSRVYTLFDAIFTQLIPLPKGKRGISANKECDRPDIIYLIDTYLGVKNRCIDQNLAKWFLRLYLRFLIKKLGAKTSEDDVFFSVHKIIDCLPIKIRQDHFVEILTDTTCKRALLFEFLKILNSEVRKSLRRCTNINCFDFIDRHNVVKKKWQKNFYKLSPLFESYRDFH